MPSYKYLHVRVNWHSSQQNASAITCPALLFRDVPPTFHLQVWTYLYKHPTIWQSICAATSLRWSLFASQNKPAKISWVDLRGVCLTASQPVGCSIPTGQPDSGHSLPTLYICFVSLFTQLAFSVRSISILYGLKTTSADTQTSLEHELSTKGLFPLHSAPAGSGCQVSPLAERGRGKH